MATMKLTVLAAACVCAYAFPDEPTGPITRSTIFADEKFEGQVFEKLDSMEEFTLSRNTDTASIYRLPNTTAPNHYKILWQIDMTRREMSGVVDITLRPTRENVNEIVIHADDLVIGNAILTRANTIVPITSALEKQTQFLRIRLNTGSLTYNAKNPVNYTLSIPFSAKLRTDMYGIYESWYRNTPGGPISWMASTQFQATSARYAFPCYDEPSFKATFDITIRRPTAFKSWTGTRQLGSEPAVTAGYYEDTYSRTPVMSTYLLALIVAEYVSKPVLDASNNNVVYEVIARPGAMSQNHGDYALDVGLKLLANMSAHTAIDFYDQSPNLKMTQAAIPDFSAGAMENWGLLTYREAYLMYDPENTNSNYKQLIAYILSHEIAHMWFGNLVTCNWWDVTWLNEGFARYYQYFLTDSVETDMGFETRFIVEQVHVSLLSDSANNPHPLSTTNIGDRASVSAMFSTITYNKGASIIRMTEHLLTSEVHREGLRKYLRKYEYKNTLPIDLFETLEEVAKARGVISEYGPDFSFVKYYNSWTEQAGHPVLNVQVDHETGQMTIYQRRFNVNTGYAITNNNNYIVPISFATASNPDFENTKPTHIISEAVTVIPRGSVGDEWVIFNKQQTGFYRVNYDDYTWGLITLKLRTDLEKIHEYNRAQIVNDVFQFARSGLMNYTQAFNILSFLEQETAYGPWVAAVSGFNWLRNRLSGTDSSIKTTLKNLEDQIQKWSQKVITKLTYYPEPEEAFMTSYLRFQLGPILCNIDAPDCRTEALAQYNALIATPSKPVPVDSRNWVYCNALRVVDTNTATRFNYLWTRYQTHNTYTEKILLLSVLGCTPDEKSLNTFLRAIVEDNNVIRPQDYTTAFNSAVTGNEGNTQIVFNFIKANLVDVKKAFGSAAGPLSYISGRLRNEAEITAFQNWANETRSELGDEFESVYNGAESSRESLEWAAKNQEDLETYFAGGVPLPQTTTTAPIIVTPAVTETPQAIAVPVTPDLPEPPSIGSAVTTCVSMLIVALAVIVNIVV